MFRIHVCQSISNAKDRDKDAFFVRTCSIPQPPHPGMKIVIDGHPFIVESVTVLEGSSVVFANLCSNHTDFKMHNFEKSVEKMKKCAFVQLNAKEQQLFKKGVL